MPQVLKLTHLVDDHRMADMQIGCRRIKTYLDTQRFAGLQFLLQILDLDDFFGAPRDQLEGLFYIGHIAVRFLPLFMQRKIRSGIVLPCWAGLYPKHPKMLH